MSSVMFAADTTATGDRCAAARARSAPRAQKDASLLRRAQGLAAGTFFLAARLPIYAGVLFFGTLLSLAGVVLHLIQAIGLRLIRPAGTLAVAALALICAAGPQRAKADMLNGQLVLAQAPFFTNTQSNVTETNMTSFDVSGPGTLSVYVNDIQWPTPLTSLTASILGNDSVLGSWTESQGQTSGEFSMYLQAGGEFDAFVAAVAGQVIPGFYAGMYGIRISFAPNVSPVPLPPAIDLLLGGLALLGSVTAVERVSRRRNRDVTSIA